MEEMSDQGFGPSDLIKLESFQLGESRETHSFFLSD